MKPGKAIAEKNGYTICEISVMNMDGKLIPVGYGVFNPDGKIMQAFPTLEEAQYYLDDVARPFPKP